MDDTKQTDGFIQTVFNFDDEHRGEMINLLQYTFISIIPLVFIIKVIDRVIPEADAQKSSLELAVEIIGEIFIIYMGFYFTNKIILYIHPYSTVEYPTIVLQSLSLLFIVLSMNTKISNKVNILIERLDTAWNGKTTGDSKPKKTSVKVSQPISNTNATYTQAPTQSSYATSDTSLINNLPSTSPQYATQEDPNFNAMYQSNSTPLIGANSPSYNSDSNQIMAANELLGSNSSGIW
jgi:hypothetical protein